ncbi:unnamed protein product [Xylocopa violacea]|uniref:C2H2-type domain-containing protein n=1 Tax=Xylocopa violacea TaxID=135666 RepID=A0ABP1N1E0_XYLVO
MARTLIYTRSVDAIFVGTNLDHNSDPYNVKQGLFNSISENTSANINIKFKNKKQNKAVESEVTIADDSNYKNKKSRSEAPVYLKNNGFNPDAEECIHEHSATCSVCFRHFHSYHALKIHKNKNKSQYKCNRCNATFVVLSSCKRHMKMGCTARITSNPKCGYTCHFCNRFHKDKGGIQSHLFHIHGDLIHFGQFKIDDTFCDTLRLNDSNDMLMKNVNNSNNTTPILLSDSNNTTLERLDNLNGMTLSSCSMSLKTLNESHSPSSKRMEQSTPTDLISYEEKLVEDSSIPTNITDIENITISNSLKMIHESRNKITEMPVTSNCDKAPMINNGEPLDQICPNFSTMITPLDMEIKIEFENAIISYDTHYNLESKRATSHSSLHCDDSLQFEENENSEEARRKQFIDIPDKNQRIQLQDSDLKSKFKCKECMILLERCNKVLKCSNLRLGQDENTSQQVDSKQTVQQLQNAQEIGLTNKLPLRSIEIPLVTFDEFEKSVVPKLMASEQQSDVSDDNVEVNKKKLLQCNVCKKSFFRRKSIRKHMKLLHKIYTLNTCNTRYKFMNKLLQHYLSQHTVFGRKECCVCYKKFSTLGLLKCHILLHCMKIVQQRKESVPIHVKTKCIICRKQHKCTVCHKRFWLSTHLKRHQKVCREVNALTYEQNISGLMSSCINRQHTSPTKSSPLSSLEKLSNVDSSITDIQCISSTVQCTPTKQPEQMPDLEQKPTIEVINRECTENTTSNISNTTDLVHLSSHALPNKKRLINRAACVKGYQINMEDTTKFPCKICSKQFQKFQNLCIHESIFCKPANNVCNTCSTAFSTKRLMQVHILATHTPFCAQKYKLFCKFCNQGFSKKINLQVHERHFHSNHVPKPWLTSEQPCNVNPICRVCNLMFQSNARFIEHNMYYYENQTFDCRACKKSFQGIYKLHHHNKLEHYPDNINKLYVYKCNICNEGFNYGSHLHAHKLHVHPNEATSTLSDLNKTQYPTYTPVPSNVVTSVESEQISLKTYICGVCDLNFANEKDLVLHKVEYSMDGNFQCNQCNRKYRTSSILAKHYSLNHTDCDINNSFKCRFCGEVLTTNISMRCHEKHFHRKNTDLINNNSTTNKMDTSEECKVNMVEPKSDGDCVCLTCGMKFNDKDKLKNHLFEYSDIGEYTCTLCQRKFTELGVLETHKIKHTTLNTFLYRCPICNEGFANSTDIHTHVSHFHRYETFSSSSHEFTNIVDLYKTAGSV